MTYLDEDGEAFEPVCESCRSAPAAYEVTAGGEAFDVCAGCVPLGRHIDVRRIESGSRRR